VNPLVDPGAIQGLVARGFGALHHAAFVPVEVVDPAAARGWLAGLPVTSAAVRADRLAVNVAFTHHGLARLGLDPAALDGFADELRQGMVSEHRRRLLGDHGDSDPAGWAWGGLRRDGDAGEPRLWLDRIHGIVLVYAVDAATLAAALAGLAADGVRLHPAMATSWLADRKEHFGFADGIAQPGIAGLHDDPGAIAAGEFLLGYPNEYQRYPPSPMLAAPSATLPDADGRPGRDFGRDGSYLVVRQLEQDVAGLWRWVAEAAAALPIAATWGDAEDPRLQLAARMVGRWPGGAPLALSPRRDDPDLSGADDFGYARDPHGLACPFAAHVRRSNPRDWLLGGDPDEATRNSRRHRLLRRGRSYGPGLVDSMDTRAIADAADDGVKRGLLFACLNADLGRQFEFVQHTWINSPKFAGLHGDADPLIGDHHPETSARAIEATFTAPATPARLRATGIRRFVTVRGGAYFFLPSMRALRHLAAG